MFYRPAVFALPLVVLASCMEPDQSATRPSVEAQQAAIVQQRLDDCSATRCDRLDLDTLWVTDYAPATAMTHVTALMLSYTDFDDLGDIAAMSQLRELHLGATKLTDISGLSRFPNLRVLHLQMNEVADYTPLARLRGLEELALGYARLDNTNMLRGLGNLKRLNLDFAKIGSLEGLRNHPRLEELDLIDADLPDDISALTTIRTLRQLSLVEDFLTEEQRAVVAQLEARGVLIIKSAALIVC